MSRLAGLTLFTFLTAIGAPVVAQALSDPTRPPASLATVVAEEALPGAQLQSVLISSDRRIAVINGETVRQGGKYRDATVLRVEEASVVLRYPDREERLELLPGIEKRERAHRTRIAPGSGAK